MDLELILFMCVFSLAFFIPALIFRKILNSRNKKCTESAEALVIDIKRKYGGGGTSSHPVYEYYVNGIRYTREGAYMSTCVPKKNTLVPIRYNPCEPSQSYIVGYDDKVYRILSVAFGIGGLFPIILCIILMIFV